MQTISEGCYKKVCAKCDIEKSVDEFHIRKDSKDGYRNECISCWKILSKKKRIEYSNQQTREVLETKYCYICQSIKNISEFCKDKTRKDGYSNRCIICSSHKHKKIC